MDLEQRLDQIGNARRESAIRANRKTTLQPDIKEDDGSIVKDKDKDIENYDTAKKNNLETEPIRHGYETARALINIQANTTPIASLHGSEVDVKQESKKEIE